MQSSLSGSTVTQGWDVRWAIERRGKLYWLIYFEYYCRRLKMTRRTWLLEFHVMKRPQRMRCVYRVCSTSHSIGLQGDAMWWWELKYLLTYDHIRYPQPVNPWLNLLKLMDPYSWALTLASLVSLALCFNVASLVVMRWMGMRLANIEIDLWPFRWNSFNGA